MSNKLSTSYGHTLTLEDEKLLVSKIELFLKLLEEVNTRLHVISEEKNQPIKFRNFDKYKDDMTAYVESMLEATQLFMKNVDSNISLLQKIIECLNYGIPPVTIIQKFKINNGLSIIDVNNLHNNYAFLLDKHINLLLENYEHHKKIKSRNEKYKKNKNKNKNNRTKRGCKNIKLTQKNF